MKITIEVDVQPHEVQLATELMSTLRALTEHVSSQPPVLKVNGAPAAPLLAPATSNGASSNGAISALAAPPTPALQQQQAAPPQAAAPPAAGGSIEERFDLLIRQAGNAANHSLVLQQLMPLLQSSDSAPAQFVEAFERVVFPPTDADDPNAMHRSIIPYMDLLALLPEPFKAAVKGNRGITPKVLKHLTHKRQLDVGRPVFYAQCEAFAWLAAHEFVTLEGAVKTLTKMLEADTTRSAAVTMLGKTVEMCAGEMMNPSVVSSPVMQKLCDTMAARVAGPEMELFGYDVAYVQASLQWPAHLFPGIEGYQQQY